MELSRLTSGDHDHGVGDIAHIGCAGREWRDGHWSPIDGEHELRNEPWAPPGLESVRALPSFDE